MENNTITLWLAAVTSLAAFVALVAAYFSFRSVETLKRAAEGETLLACMREYITIMKDKSRAVQERDERLAREFYRELFDLHWSEFHLWARGGIPDNVMRAWLYVRKRNFDSDAIPIGEAKEVTYAEQWAEAKRVNYFEINDPFVKHMDDAHRAALTDLKTVRKQCKRDANSR